MAEPLYKLTERYMNILEIAEMLDAEQLEEALAGIDDDIEVKADGYARVIKELDNTADGLDKEIKRLTDRKKTITNNAKRMKESLQDSMLLTGKTKFKTDLFSFNIQKNAASLSVLKEDYIPKRFYEEQAPILDKRGLLKYLKETEEELEGVEIKQTESLRIR